MINKIVAMALAVAIGVTAFAGEASATGIFANIRARQQARQHNQRVVNKVVVERVVVDNRVHVNRNTIRVPVRTTRIVEVPNLNVREEIIVIRDQYGNVVDVKKQRVLDVNNHNKNQVREKVILRQEIRGY